jgi:hypothetical protein
VPIAEESHLAYTLLRSRNCANPYPFLKKILDFALGTGGEGV